MGVDTVTGAEKISSSKARDQFSTLLSRVGFGGERFIINRYEDPVAVLVSYEDAVLLEEIENEKIARKARKASSEEEPMAWEEAKEDLEE